MIRQDKIAYLIAGFTGLRKVPLYPEDTPMGCLVRTILSQGTRDENRDMAMDRLMTECDSWDQVYKLDKNQLKHLITPAGLAGRKSETIVSFLNWCKQKMDGFDLSIMEEWSTERIMNALTSIPGIGVKTAAIFCCFSLRRAVFPVDVHVHRILTRTGITARRLNPKQVFHEVDAFIPHGRDYFLHCHLIEHGRAVCKTKPLCEECSFSEHCDYYLEKNDWAMS